MRLLPLLLAVLGACSVDTHSGSRSTASALTVGSLTPVPCFSGKPSWEGNFVQLLTADALAACSQDAVGTAVQVRLDDLYLIKVRDWMVGLGALTFQQWIANRNNAQLNCDPVTGQPGISAKISPTPVRERLIWPGLSSGEPLDLMVNNANSDIRTAALNLCIAQHLRTVSPGASGGEALLLSDAEQREMLETIRERAQIATLQYALLGVAFVRPFAPADLEPFNASIAWRPIPLIQLWSEVPCAGSFLTGSICGLDVAPGETESTLQLMGRDFATAAQLMVEVTQEMTRLAARSRSARTAYGADAPTRADEAWGEASWFQRGLSVLYGGDPLAVRANGPWKHPLGFKTPAPNIGVGGDWPTADGQPFVTADTAEPQVAQLFALARRLNRVYLQQPVNGKIPVNQSATFLYDIVERFLRLEDCEDVDPVTGACNFPSTVPADSSKHLLWKKFRITRAHATKLAQLLSDSIGNTSLNVYPPYHPAAQNIDGVLEDFYEPNTNTWVYRLANSVAGAPTSFSQLTLAQRTAPYQAFAPRRFPTAKDLDPGAFGADQGFVSTSSPDETINEAKRTLGAVPALAATREMLFSALAYLQNPPSPLSPAKLALRQSYFAQSDAIIQLINAAIGPGSVTVRPMVEPVTQVIWTQDWNYVAVPRLVPKVTAGKDQWEVSVFFEPGGDFAGVKPTDEGTPTSEGNVRIIAIPDNPWAGNLAKHPGTKILGKTIFDFTQVSSYNLTHHFNGATSKDQEITGAKSAPWRRVYSDIPLTQNQFWTLVRRRYNEPTDQVRLVMESVRLASSAKYGQQFAGGGEFGTWANQQSQALETNPTKPAFDGFGMPTNWVPPLNAKLVGGQDGSSSAEFYLTAAKEKSKQASAAVESALENLLVEQSSEAELGAATAKANAALQEEAEALCGAGKTTCDTLVGTYTPNYPGVSPPPTCPPSGSDIVAILNCFVQGRVDSMNSLRPSVAKAVADKLDAPAAPQFDDYSGGLLQGLFIEQWAALREPGEHVAALHAASSAVQARIATAKEELAARDAVCQDNCSVEAMIKAGQAGTSTSVSVGTSVGIPSSVDVSVSVSFSPGPLIQQMQKCKDVCTEVAPAQSKAIESMLEAFASLNAAAQGLSDAGARIVKSGAAIQLALNQSRLASERAKLELELTKTSQITSYGLYRRYRSYDLWRAKALLEDARRYSLAARRAVEARYVVNLSDLTAPEAFVYSPASWADEVYTYDLALPAAVGLSVGSAAPGGIYSNKLNDYVSNLEGFVDGYAVTRPAAVAQKDIDVVTLPGLIAETVEVPPGTDVVPKPTISPWMLLCPAPSGGPPVWKAVSAGVPVDQTCGKEDCDGCGCAPACSSSCIDACSKYVSPTRARLLFNLDPWGRKDQGYADPPYENRFNARWSHLAVNFVGTGILDCKKAADPQGCYAQSFIRYDLRQVGPAWITNYEGGWRTLAVPAGTIEAAKGLAAELWLDPLKDGWDTSYIGAVSRSELANRPFGGAYTLEFDVKPETRLDRIERVQILSGQEYWVKQQ